MTGPVCLQAEWVIPVGSPALYRGVVTIVDGLIAHVGKRPEHPVCDLGGVALLPGLVNAHTHLEFSDLVQPLGEPRMPFPEWIRRAIQYRLDRGDDQQVATQHHHSSVGSGLDQSEAAGTTAIGEIASAGWPNRLFADSQLSATIFLELLGLSHRRIGPLRELAEAHIRQLRVPGSDWRAGLSPHAPYTVHPQLLEVVCELSRTEQFPVAMHLAETFDEIELLGSACGRLVNLLTELDAWDPTVIPRGITILNYLEQLAHAHRALVIHGNYLTTRDIEFLAQHRDRMVVVYCPRTADYFGHSDHPLSKLLSAGAHVALGTDSRASNPNLNVFEEMQFVAQSDATIAPQRIIELATIQGARALGVEHEIGSLATGKYADMTIISLPDPSRKDVLDQLLSPEAAVVGRVFRGNLKWV